MLTIDGIASGLDTQSIVEGLTKIQQQRIDRLKLQKSEILKKQTAFQTIEASIVAFRGTISTLARSQNNVLKQLSVASSDESVLVATAGSAAAPGIHHVSVESIARAHQVASQEFSSSEARLTHGTLEIRAGDGPLASIVVDGSNDNLQALATTISNEVEGVSAAVIQTGTGYRLLLSSDKTGTSQEIQINSTLAADSGEQTQVVFDLGNPVQAAADSVVKLGSGAGAITVTSSNTRVDNLLPGVSLDLLKAAPGQDVTISIAGKVDAGVAAVEDFVSAYNGLINTIAAQTKYVPDSGAAGPLLGEYSVLEIQNSIQLGLQGSVEGLTGPINRLTAIGLSFNDDGTLSLNKTRLTDILSGRVENASASDVKKLFALAGESTNSGISFVLGSSETKASSTPYQVDIIQAAERATVAGGTSLAASSVIDDSNNTLSVTLDGQQIDIVLASGTYTRSELAAKLASTINAHPNVSGRRVSTSVNPDGTLSLTSQTYGKSSELIIHSGTALATLGLTAGQSDLGVDVAGQFIVNGQVEAATGNGRVLSGLSTNENTAGLQVRVSLGPDDIVAGVEGELTVTQGVGSRLDNLLSNLLDATSGRLGVVNRSFSDRADAIQETIDRQNKLFEDQKAQLLKEMQALESAISELQGTSTMLGSQLSSLSSLGTSSSTS
ncbi:MAG: flagellar filament capping protein FliD [Planctomycetaceae bacterium]|nr:flagellar filament capping protein FliD [Planctomycetaceae bacterium]